MTDDHPRRARVRPEYLWQHVLLDPARWYRVLQRPSDDPMYVWLDTRPSPLYTRAEHFEIEVDRDAPAHLSRGAAREARLRDGAVLPHAGIDPHRWYDVRSLLDVLRPPRQLLVGERRQERLPAELFVFRDRDATAPSHD